MTEPAAVVVSVVIVSYNCREHLRACLDSIRRYPASVTSEVIVVDNASHDDTAGMVAREYPECILVASERNLGFAGANNVAARHAQGRLLLLLNPDTEVYLGAIDAAVRFLDADPGLGAMGCRIELPGGGVQPSIGVFPGLVETLRSRLPIMGTRDISSVHDHEHYDVDYVSGAFLLVRRSAFEQLGGFDEDYFVYAEEADFSYRLSRLGLRVGFSPAGTILHHGGVSSPTFGHQVLLRLAGRMKFFRKHRSWLERFAYQVLATLLFSALALRHSERRAENGRLLRVLWTGQYPHEWKASR